MKCIRCGGESYSSKICSSCLSDWTNMRTIAFNYVEGRIGKFSPTNDQSFKKEMKRLDKLWRKDREAFNAEISTQIED